MKQTLNEDQVKALFSSRSKEFDILLGLLALAIPDWDKVEYVLEGKVGIGELGWHAIYDLFYSFNESHPGESVFPGGLWLSMGFAMDKSLGGWEVDTSAVKLIFKAGTES